MRARIVIPIVIVVIVGAALAVVLTRNDASGSGQEASSRSGALPSRTVDAGGVQVVIVPVRLDDSGAVFKVTLDTHSGDLGVDLARAAELQVGGSAWRSPVWKGDPPGGHHREGELLFTPAGAASGDVTLSIGGLPGPVVAEWALPGR